MHGSKLFDILALLSREEQRLFYQHLKARLDGYGNEQENIFLLFKHIFQHITDLEHSSLSKEKAFTALFPENNYKSSKMDKLMSSLLFELSQFIGKHYNDFDQTFVPEQLALVKFFRQRNALAYGQYYFKKLNKAIDQIKAKGNHHYFNKYLVEKEVFEQNKTNEKRMQQIDHLRSMPSLDIYYLVSKLEHACFVLSVNQFRKPLKTKTLVEFLTAIKPLYQNNGILDHPIVKLYYSLFEILNQEEADQSNFDHIQNIIDQEAENIPFSTLKILTGILRTFIIHQHNIGTKIQLSDLFKMQKKHLIQGYMIDESGISPSIFKNMVTVGIRLNEFEWVHDFIHEYKDKIEGKPIDSEIYHYNLAQYYFATKDYEQAFDLVMRSFDDIYYKIAAKGLELKILYETNSSILSSRIEAFKLFIYRLSSSQIIDYKKQSAMDFVNIFRQLINPTTQLDNSKLKRIRKKIINAGTIYEEDWLLTVADRLIKK